MNSSNPEQKKIIQTFDTLVEAMKVSSEELNYRKKKSEIIHSIKEYQKLFKCTKCQLNLKSVIAKEEKIPKHPFLKVLMCQKCCDYYRDGEFSLDSDGEDKYCRWCGEGGTILSCSRCICGFCAVCIKKHFRVRYYKKAQKNDDWLCFICNPRPLWRLRFICSLATKMSNTSTQIILSSDSSNIKNVPTDHKNLNSEQSVPSETLTCNSPFINKKKSQRKRIYSSDESSSGTSGISFKKIKSASNLCESSSEKSKNNSSQNVKFNVSESKNSEILKTLENILKLSEYRLNFGITWITKLLEKLRSPNYKTTQNDLINECQKIKWFFCLLSSNLVEFGNSVGSIEKNLLSTEEVSSNFCNENESSFITILQFLDFVNKQVKTFIEKDISLPDILQAEIFDDGNVIGFKKKLNSLNSASNPYTNVESHTNERFSFKSNKNTENKEYCDDHEADDEDNSGCENNLLIVTDQDESIDATKDNKNNHGSVNHNKKSKNKESLKKFRTDGKSKNKNSDIAEGNVDLDFTDDDEEPEEHCSDKLPRASDLKVIGSQEDIQEILAILENA